MAGQIDLSAGLGTGSAQPQQPAQGQPSQIDLSAGLIGQNPSSSGQPPVPEASFSDQLAQQEGEAGKAFGAGAEETATGLAKIGSHIPGVSYLSDKIGNALGLPKLGNNANPYDMAQQAAKSDVNATTQTTAGKIGYGGENLTEFILGDEALKGLSFAEKLKAASGVAAIFEKSPKLMHAAQVGATMLRHGAVQGAQTLAKTGDVNEATKEGVTQALVSGVLGGAGAAVSGFAENAAPEAEKIAGVEVPKTPLNEAKPSLKAKILKPLATTEGAQKAIDTQTQPQAVKATIANLDQSALDKINNLRGLRGETPAEFDPKTVQSVGNIADHLQNEAQTTYKKFDKVSDELRTEWQQQVKDVKTQNKEALQAWKDSQVSDEGSEPKPSKPKPEEIPAPPEPESFTDMQAQIQKARNTLKSSAPNDAKEAAIHTLDEYNQKIEDFTNKHSEAAGVGDDERRAANKAYQTSTRYDWINNKLQSALTNSAGATGDEISEVKKINPITLKAMPGQFDKKFGEGSFRAMLGEGGWNNYLNVIKALQNPIVKNRFSELAKHSVVAGSAQIPAGMAADRVLFSPPEGSMFLRLADKAVKAAKPLSPVIKQQVGQILMGKKGALANVLSGASEPLSNGADQQ
jgi:hypothetical protein